MTTRPQPSPDAGAAPRDVLDVEALRRDFPILTRKLRGKPLVYFDNAASTQKPRQVLDAMRELYETSYSNVHRGLHRLSAEATDAYEAARHKVQRFIGAADAAEIVFTSGTTAAINTVAMALGRGHVTAGDEILLTEMEHHSNIVPWKLLAEQSGAHLRVLPVDDAGELRIDRLDALLGPRTRLVALAHTSNALGTRNPLSKVIEAAHARGIPVLVDGAQAMAHGGVDVQALDCDFFAFSGHKMFGPTGIGVLYGKRALLEELPPAFGGGEMIHTVSFETISYKPPPQRFEAGTPPFVEAVGLGAAIDYLEAVGLERIRAHEQRLLEIGTALLERIPGLRLIGTARDKTAIFSFVLEGIHPHDAGTVLDAEGIAVRAGHHCAQPLMERYHVPATLRASLACYNTPEELEALARGLGKAIEVLG